METKKPIVFKAEDSLWKMMADGIKTWDCRRHDIGDDRIYRLSWGKFDTEFRHDRQPCYLPIEDFVYFENKLTGRFR